MITAKEMYALLPALSLDAILADIEEKAKAQTLLGYTELDYINNELMYPEEYSAEVNRLFVGRLIAKLKSLGYGMTFDELIYTKPDAESVDRENRITISWS